MKCQRCGVGLGPEAEYCPVCGAKVEVDEGERSAYVPRHLATDRTEADDWATDWTEPDGDDDWEGDEDFDEFDELGDAYDDYLDEPDFGEPDFDESDFGDEAEIDSGAHLSDEPESWEFTADDWPEPERPHPIRRVLTYIAVIAAVAVMALLMMPMTSSPSGRAPVVISTPAALYPSEVASSDVTQRSVLERATELGITSATDWTPTFDEDGCLTEASAQQATDLLNLYRFAAGVEPVEFTQQNDERAQAVVDVYAGSEFQAHTLTIQPADMDDATFSMAREAAQRSNVGVGWGNWGKDLPAYIAEVDPNPIQPNYETVGHRRHLLGTSLADVGFGLNGPYSAIYVGDFDGGRIDETVVWPACETPLGLWIQGSPWSVSLPYAIGDDDAVTVRIARQRDGRIWEMDDMAHFFIDHGSYHDASAVVFTPADLLVESGDRYEVVVEGLDNGPLSYVVDFFNIGFELR